MSFTTYHSRREQQYGEGNPKGERVASFQSDVNSSTSPPKMTTERRGKMGKNSNKIIAKKIILELQLTSEMSQRKFQ